MKKRVVRLAVLLLLPLLLMLISSALPAQYSRTYLAVLKDKTDALESSPSPRIVLVGGSGMAFSADCALLDSLLPPYTAVNCGLYAGLGVPVMLELVLPSLKSGDIVVFSPEMSAQTLSDWFNPVGMLEAAEEDPRLLARLDPSRYASLLGAFPRFAAQKARFFLEGNAPAGNGVYARSSFTERGDILADLRPANRMSGGWDRNMPLSFDPGMVTGDFIRRVNAFADTCSARGITVYFRFCPMNLSALPDEEWENIDAFAGYLEKTLHCPVIGNARRALMEAGWFFDTNFHLNAAGAAMNTILLAEDLKQALKDPSPVNTALPEMPPVPGDGEMAEGLLEDGCFIYEHASGGLILTGLTEKGSSMEVLAVPDNYLGHTVISVSASAFSKGQKLRRITLPDTLVSIADGAFDGCSALESIILTLDEPGKCSVGRELLRGTEAVILIPGNAYGSYCTDYFWSVYAARFRSSRVSAASTPQPAPLSRSVPPVTRLCYEGNGGVLRTHKGDTLTREVTFVHRRENTLQGTVWFQREGYVLTGWNTAPDGSGISVGLGSRFDLKDGDTLYAMWLPCSPDTDFSWEIIGSGAAITGYRGDDPVCVLPESLGGCPVRTVCNGAFNGKSLSLLVLSPSVRTVESGAFRECVITEMILYDSLVSISDASFLRCSMPVTLQINAATSPVYSGSYFDTFQDKYERLLSLRGQKKLVLSSGSSGRYGYDCTLIQKAFPDLAPVNMGVYAFTNALPQLRLMLPLMEEGDILLYAPEFDAVAEQFCVSDALDTGFWAMMESCYDTVSKLDMKGFSCVFDSFGEYLSIRSGMPARDYTFSPANYDDDGNFYNFSTYNEFGDFILPRPLGDTDACLRHNIADYTLVSFTADTVECLNAALAPFAERGIMVYFTYTPRNINSLTEDSTPVQRNALHEYLKSTLDYPVISSIEDSLLPGRYFWLIDSHTGTEGAKIRTQQVIYDLEQAIREK